MESQFQLNKHTLSQWWVSQYMVKVVLLPASKVLRESKNPHPMAAVDSLSTQTCSNKELTHDTESQNTAWYFACNYGQGRHNEAGSKHQCQSKYNNLRQKHKHWHTWAAWVTQNSDFKCSDM
jgi:hypothetical protein